MAADEYFDAIGDVLSYVLSAEDFIVGQNHNDTGKYFIIRRDNTDLEFFAEPNKRYFLIVYQFSLSQTIIDAYESNNQLLRGHIEKFDIDDAKIGDENLNQRVATQRIKEIEEDEARKIVKDIRSLIIHSDCRIENTTITHSQNEGGEEEIWDGVLIAGLLYPYENGFSPRDYEQVAQEVISVGNQIDTSMEKLDVMEEIGFEST